MRKEILKYKINIFESSNQCNAIVGNCQEGLENANGRVTGKFRKQAKRKTKMLLLPNSIIPKTVVKRYAIRELEEKCLTFESGVSSLEQENHSLRIALIIIMQEKSKVT